jgi:hypothetical protein
MADKAGRRRRSSSILQVYHEPPEPIEQLSDQSALPNLNADWVNAKGTLGSEHAWQCPARRGPSLPVLQLQLHPYLDIDLFVWQVLGWSIRS